MSEVDYFNTNYREPFICPYHNCRTDGGWCWECAEETYGYEEAKRIYNETHHPNNMLIINKGD